MRRPDLAERVDVSTIVLFRILFGVLLIGEVLYVWYHASTDFPDVEFRPAYSLLPWTRSLPQPDLDFFAPLLLTALLALVVGLLTRFAAAVFTVDARELGPALTIASPTVVWAYASDPGQDGCRRSVRTCPTVGSSPGATGRRTARRRCWSFQTNPKGARARGPGGWGIAPGDQQEVP